MVKGRSISDKVEEWATSLVVIKNDESQFVTKTGNLTIETILSYGQDIIPLLQTKPEYQLPKEEDAASHPCIVIDNSGRKLFINQSEFGLWEQTKELWEGYEFTMGDFGYIETLKLAGIETANLELAEEKVIEQFNSIVNHKSNFDPYEMAEKLTNENSDILFNPDFFDTVRPQRTTWDKLKKHVKKILGR